MKEIAFQAGVSLATVDRALHGRAGVRAVTRARVAAAIGELERQYGAVGLAGRRVSIDVVMEAPRRFSDAVRAAFEAELPALRPASVTARFHVGQTLGDAEFLSILKAIRRRGSHGVVLKAPLRDGIAEMARGLMAAGIPVLTFVTDLPEDARAAYVGIDNRAAGAAAAWLMGHMLVGRPCEVMTTMSSAQFSGEDERVTGFREAMAERFPKIGILQVSEGMGLERDTKELVAAALEAHPGIGAVYSVGGGNRAVLQAFREARRECRVFAAHDLDRANRALLAARQLTFVIHHDLRQDARTVCQAVLHYHRMLSDEVRFVPSRFEVVTPEGLVD